MKDLLLVSASPRRRELLQMIGVSFDVFNADIDESRHGNEDPESYVNRLALEKVRAGISAQGLTTPALGADTVVLLGDEILQKPVDRDDARTMLRRISGQVHRVLSAVAVVRMDGRSRQALNVTEVEMGDIPESWIDFYSTTDEPMDKAGSYAVQGLAGQWIRRINGSYSGVMGLPLYETSRLLRWAGLGMHGPGQ